MIDNDFALSRHPDARMTDFGLSQPNRLFTDDVDSEGDCIGMLRGGMGQRMVRVQFISGQNIHEAAGQANVADQISWL